MLTLELLFKLVALLCPSLKFICMVFKQQMFNNFIILQLGCGQMTHSL